MLSRFASNAGANILSGAVAAGYQLTITGMASRVWHGSAFSSWALALSIAAIAPLFATSLSGVVTRRVVHARHSGSPSSESAIVLGARRLGYQLNFMALTVLICAGVWIHLRSESVTSPTSEFLVLLVVLLISNSWLLLWQVRFGQHYADEGNWPPALTVAAARMGGAAGMLAGLAIGKQQTLFAALGLCLGTWAGLACANLLLPKPTDNQVSGSSPTIQEIKNQYRANARLLSGFAVGTVSLLIVQYSIPPFMAVIAPAGFNAFYIASMLNASAIALLSAALAATLAPFSRWHAREDAPQLRRITLLSPILCASSCLGILLLCWLAMGPALQVLSIRAASIDDVRTFLALLGFQTIIRNAAAGYGMHIAAAGSPRQMAASLVIEIVLALSVALPLGWQYGERALLFGMMLSGMISTIYCCYVIASLQGANRISVRTSLPALLTAQFAVCAAWWLLVRSSL